MEPQQELRILFMCPTLKLGEVGEGALMNWVIWEEIKITVFKLDSVL